MPAPKNLVAETSSTTGTGNFTVAAVNGHQRCSAAFGTGSSNKFDYYISNRDAAEYERGIGYMSDANTLVRDTVLESTNSDAAVNFSAGTKDVTNDRPADMNTGFDKSVVKRKSSNQTSTSTTMADLTDLSFSIGASETWIFEAEIFGAGSVGQAWPVISVNGPASPSSVAFNACYLSNGGSSSGDTVAVGGVLLENQNAYNADNFPNVNTSHPPTCCSVKLVGQIVNGANAGTFTLRLARSHSSGTATVYAGSILKAWRVA